MNLVEFIICVAYILICGGTTWLLGPKFGVMGYVGGFFLGTLGTVAVLGLLAYMMVWLGKRISGGVPHYPACANGCCSEDDYKWSEGDSWPVLLCRCGDQYNRRGKQFLRVDAAGRESPYLRWKPFSRWIRDE